MNEKSERFFNDKRRIAIAALAIIAVVVLIIGLTATWFVDSKRLETVGKVQSPAEIKVLGPNETAMEEIPLTYEPAEFVDHKVKLTRTFSVVSGGSFTLYLAHTTNIRDLDIKLYRVDEQTGLPADVVGDADGTPFYWNRRDGEAVDADHQNGNLYPGEGSFVNPKDNSDPKLAIDPNGQIFSGAAVQDNAIPLYWKLGVTDPDKKESTKYTVKDGTTPCKVTNFIIDISWTDSSKETDVLYLIAKS